MSRAFDAGVRQIIRACDEFIESEHPRATGGETAGQFVKGGGGGTSGGEKKERKSKHQLTAAPQDRDHWPEHVKKLVIPPAWTDLKINEDPKGDLLVTGKDAKGRLQSVYSEKFKATKAAEKFQRIHQLDKKFDAIQKQNEDARMGKDPVKREHAEVTRLIMLTGLRPGSETDTGAEKQAYGATTLKGEHVKREDGKVILDFTGKKGVDLKIPVTDPDLVESLTARAEQAGPSGKLFPEVSDKSLLGYVHSLDGGKFKTKDMRTRLGTATAADIVKTMTPPKNAKEYKKAVKEVATIVSQKLGNTPTVALQSYISPVVFAQFRQSAGV
jgi:DNA topoisomerase-1